MQPVKHTLKKEERLKSRKMITELFHSGKIIHSYPFKALYILSEEKNNEFHAQFAISVSKKNFKQAVERNYIKRKVRETYRLNKHLLYKELIRNNKNVYLFVIYTATEDLHITLIEKGIKNLITKLSKKLS